MTAADQHKLYLYDVAPELCTELHTLLLEEGEGNLAIQVDQLLIVDRCRCGDDCCSTFYTAPRKGPYGPEHFTVALAADIGIINIDVVAGKIVCVEVIDRDDIKAKIHAALP
jgi:hypothetical protein